MGKGPGLSPHRLSMTEHEFSIVNFLKGSPEAFFARKEIARKAVKRTVYEQNQHWANEPLVSLVARGIVEVNDSGYYRIKRGADF
jgi:hypothetical protein